jgi:hypothetical protein
LAWNYAEAKKLIKSHTKFDENPRECGERKVIGYGHKGKRANKDEPISNEHANSLLEKDIINAAKCLKDNLHSSAKLN